MKQFRDPKDVHKPVGAYSHQVEISGGERLLVISGQIGMREDGDIPDDPVEQTALAMETVLRNVRAAGMAVTDLLKVMFYFVGSLDSARLRTVLLNKLQGHQPTSTAVYVTALGRPNYRVEIEAWASRVT